MKKIKFQKKLYLNKETVAYLNDQQMSNVNGGAQFLTLWSCGEKPQKTFQGCPNTTPDTTASTFTCNNY